MQAQRSGKMSWLGTTVKQRIFWPAAAQRSRRHPAQRSRNSPQNGGHPVRLPAQSKNSRKQSTLRPAAKSTGKKKQPAGNRGRANPKKQKNAVQNKTVWAVLLAAVVLGLLMRALAMGLL